MYKLGFAFAMVREFVYQLSFVGKNLYFEMPDLVEVVVHAIPVYMVQNYLVYLVIVI